MAERGIKQGEPKDEFQQIMELIREGDNFLLSGGAGSGKTYSLAQVIKQVIAENPTAKIACMTYTNAAVKEIEERVNHENLNVSTIHDFLWDNIKHFQKELKQALVVLINNPEITKLKISDVETIPNTYFDEIEKSIQYKEYLRLREGIISHDELLIVANYLFEQNPKLSDILKDKYAFIFIDEYQDTNPKVVDIFLTQFKQSNKKNIIGFFGDSMQSIYEDGVGDIVPFIESDDVKEVQKEQNRRNPKRIYELANKLRTDGLTQRHSSDFTAPNMQDGVVKEGNIKFLYSTTKSLDEVKQYITDNFNWDFEDSKETKELNLTHNLIADKAGFRTLMDMYDKDLNLKYRDRIKDYIKDNTITTDFSENTFREVVEQLKEGKSGSDLKKVLPTKGMQEYIDANPETYSIFSDYKYPIALKIYFDKDQLIDDKKQDEEDENKKGSKRDNLIKHLYKIQTNIALYINKQYNEFIRKTDYRINSIADKIKLKESIEALLHTGEKTIEEIINEADKLGICLIDDNLIKFQQEKEYLYNRVKQVKFSEFQKLYEYLEGKTPFSTQHKTKGAEYNNVFVILDNGRWNDYNFEYLFTNRTDKESVLKRTQKIFYVCCTRAKENLVVYYHQPSPPVIAKAKEWFREENVISLG